MDIINQLLNKIHLRTRMTRMGVDGLRWVTGCSWLLGSEGMVAGVTSGCPARAWAGTGCRRGRGCWRRAGWRTRPAAPRGPTATPPGPPPSSSWTAACWSPQPANNHYQITIAKYLNINKYCAYGNPSFNNITIYNICSYNTIKQYMMRNLSFDILRFI